MYKVELYVRVRRACMVEGMSTREAARVFELHRDTVRKMLEYSVPPGYHRTMSGLDKIGPSTVEVALAKEPGDALNSSCGSGGVRQDRS